MPRVPSSVQGLLNFCNDHTAVWQSAGGAIGVTSGMIALFKTATTDAMTAVSTQQIAKDAAKASTVTSNKAVKNLRTNVSGMIRAITTYASAQTNPDAVYALAQIDPPSPATPSEPPGQPTNITATLDDEGNITLRWRCVNPPGGNVVYTIGRRAGSTGDFQQIGVTGSRSFVDDTIPGGSTTVQYVIRGFRGQTVGDASAIFTLQFGHGGGLTFGEAKLAA